MGKIDFPIVSRRYEPSSESAAMPAASHLTVIVPAYNEAESIADTILSLQRQTLLPEEIIVVDDCSSDRTAEVARSFGVTVLQPPRNTGTKAGAQNFALSHVHTRYTIAIDADTTLAPDAIEKLMPAFNDPDVVAACGMVVPRHVHTVWERGRYVEYLFAFSFYKLIQDYYRRPLISSGCFSAYQTSDLKEVGGWPARTMAEDMDLTWTFHAQEQGVRFIGDAVCYPIEPHDYAFMSKQLRRWSHGFVQNVHVHWRSLLQVPVLRTLVAVALWDAVFASLAYMVFLPLLAIFVSPWFLLAYLIDAPAIMLPVLRMALSRHEFWKAFASIPSFFVLRTVNGFFMLRAIWDEWVVRKRLTVYEKGH